MNQESRAVDPTGEPAGEPTGQPAEEPIYLGEAVVAVAPRAGLPRFGIGAAMVMVSVLACQFALINYFGPIAALAIAPVICGGLVVALLAAEIMAWRRPQGNARRWSRRAFGWAVGYIFVLGLSAYLTGGAQIGYTWFQQWRLDRRVRNDLGFTYVTAFVRDSHASRKAIFLVLVEPGGPCDQAGLMAGEAVISELPPAEWLRMVDENRGKEIDVTVAQGAVGRPLEKCPHRTVQVVIPP